MDLDGVQLQALDCGFQSFIFVTLPLCSADMRYPNCFVKMMMFRFNSFFFVALAIITAVCLGGCHDDEVATTVVSVNVFGSYAAGDKWAFITDAGEVLDAQPCLAGTTVQLSTRRKLENVKVT